jgi:hypothetical protein
VIAVSPGEPLRPLGYLLFSGRQSGGLQPYYEALFQKSMTLGAKPRPRPQYAKPTTTTALSTLQNTLILINSTAFELLNLTAFKSPDSTRLNGSILVGLNRVEID